MGDRSAFFKNIGKCPEGHFIHHAVALTDRIGNTRSDERRVARFIHALHIPLRPEQRQIRHGRRLDLVMHPGHGAADAFIHRHVFSGVQHVFGRVIRIAMCRHKVDRHMVCRCILQKLRYPVRGRGRRSSDTQPWAYPLQGASRVRVEIEITLLARNAIPEIDIRLVPHLEIPLRDFINTVTIDQVLREVLYQVVPAFHALRRRNILLVPERMQRIRIEGQLLRHKADLDQRPHAILQQAIVNLVDVGEVIDRVAVLVLVINTDFVVKDRVEAHVFEIGDLLHGTQILAIAFPQREDGAARTEHLVPEMRERSRLRLCINGDHFLCQRRLRRYDNR